jgi:hypothetical protein
VPTPSSRPACQTQRKLAKNSTPPLRNRPDNRVVIFPSNRCGAIGINQLGTFEPLVSLWHKNCKVVLTGSNNLQAEMTFFETFIV